MRHRQCGYQGNCSNSIGAVPRKVFRNADRAPGLFHFLWAFRSSKLPNSWNIYPISQIGLHVSCALSYFFFLYLLIRKWTIGAICITSLYFIIPSNCIEFRLPISWNIKVFPVFFPSGHWNVRVLCLFMTLLIDLRVFFMVFHTLFNCVIFREFIYNLNI